MGEWISIVVPIPVPNNSLQNPVPHSLLRTRQSFASEKLEPVWFRIKHDCHIHSSFFIQVYRSIHLSVYLYIYTHKQICLKLHAYVYISTYIYIYVCVYKVGYLFSYLLTLHIYRERPIERFYVYLHIYICSTRTCAWLFMHYVSVCLSVRLSVCPSVRPSVRPSTCLSIFQSNYVSICLHIYPSN